MEGSTVTAEDAVPILTRWIRELQVDLSELRIQNEHLRQRAQIAADVRWWMEKHTPHEVREIAEMVI